MDLREVITSQYLASLSMLKDVIEKCPEDLWDREKDVNRFWSVAYHALFYAHLYMQPTENDFIPWVTHRDSTHDLNSLKQQRSEGGANEVYSKAEVLEYLKHCQDEVSRIISKLDMEGESGFYWLPFSKLELQFYNIRHLQLHTGELSERLWDASQIELRWVGMSPS